MLTLAGVGALLACAASPTELWDNLLRSPDDASFAELSRGIDAKRCAWGSAANTEVVPERVRAPLLELIASGNKSAFLIGLSTIRCFDGGDLKDLYQSSGQFMEQRPRDFFSLVTDRGVDLSDVAAMIASVPTNDDPGAALKDVAKRIELLRALDERRFERVRTEGIRVLQAVEHDLRRM